MFVGYPDVYRRHIFFKTGNLPAVQSLKIIIMSNKEKINSIRKQIDEFKAKLINEYEEAKNIKFIYQLVHPYTDNEIQKMKVSGIDIVFSKDFYNNFHEPAEKQRYRASDVAEWKDWFEHMKVSDYDLQFECIYSTDYGLDNACLTECFVNYKELCKGEYFFSDEIAAKEKGSELHEIYGHKEGYTPCTHCFKQIPDDRIIWKDIIMIKNQKVVRIREPFCSEKCAADEQSAVED